MPRSMPEPLPDSSSPRSQLTIDIASVVDVLPSAVMVLDEHLCVQAINSAMSALCGISSQTTLIGSQLDELPVGREIRRLIEQWQAKELRAECVSLEFSLNGASRLFECRVTEAYAERQKLMLLTAEDVAEQRGARDELRWFRAAFDSMQDAIYLIDRERMRFIDANATACAMLGYTRDELLKLGPQDLRPEREELAQIQQRFDDIIQSKTRTGIFRTAHRRKEGDLLSVEITLRALVSGTKHILVAAAKDISERLQTEAVLRESEERFRAAFNQAVVGLAHVARDGRWLLANSKLCEIVGYPQEELLSMRFQDITHPDDLPNDLQLVARMFNGELEQHTREKRYRRRNGSYVWVNLTTSMVRNIDGAPKYLSTMVEDISRRKEVERALLHLEQHDTLTSLPNRTLLLDRLSQAIVYAQRAAGQLAVLLIDLDRFKNVNDSLGHDIGDQLLFEISRRLAACVGPGDTVARFSGDEFVIIRPGLRSEESVALLAQRLLAVVAEPLQVASHEFYPTCSIGISLYPRDGRDCPTLLKNADTAMYRAKDSGRNNFQFYARAMNAQALERLKLESGLQRALERGEFRLHYQPQIDLSRGRMMGVEALLRWQPPGQPALSPAGFIPIAEETGLILPIGEWALRSACAQYATWQSHSDLRQLRIAVNLSVRQFKQQDIVKMVSSALVDTGCPAHALELEITESVLMDDPDKAAYTMRQLAEMGIQLSIDDFGTGYSSLNYLKRLPIHALKIDRSFVRDITTDADDATIAKAVIALAHSLKLSVIAEGVETAEQRDFLFHQRCDKMQGYFLGRPQTNHQLEQQFAAYGSWSR